MRGLHSGSLCLFSLLFPLELSTGFIQVSFVFPFFPFLFLKGRERGGTRVDKSCWGRPSVCVFLVYGQVSGIVWSACFLLPCVC